MIRTAMFALVLSMLAGCSSPPATGRDLERLSREYERGGVSPLAAREGEDTCAASAHTDRIGTLIGEWRPPEGSRVIRPGDAVTRDLRRERLNVILDGDGRITALECY